MNSPAVRLHQILALYSSSQSADSTSSELVDFLNSVSALVASEPENEEFENTAFEVLSEIHSYLSSPSLHQDVVDALSFELPKAVARFSVSSKRCKDVSESILDGLVATCNPRDMLSILCEALGSPGITYKACSYYALIFISLRKVLLSIERRHFEQLKVAVPCVLSVLRFTSLEMETDVEDADVEDLFNKALGLVDSIREICFQLEGKDNKRICALFGLTVLQIMALASISMGHEVSRCLPVVLELSRCFRSCRLSYLGLITGCDIDKTTSNFLEGKNDEDDFLSCFSYVKHGAALAVIWGQLSSEVSVAAEEDLAKVIDELKTSRIKRWLAVGSLKHIFSCGNLSMLLKKHAIDFLLLLMEGNILSSRQDENIEDSVNIPSLYAALQALQMVIIYASDRVLRKKAFDAFRMVLVDIPASPRLDILAALIKNSDSSSMIGILIDCTRGEMHKENCQRVSNGNGVPEEKNIASQSTAFWSPEVLELVEFILRPPGGGPPVLPEFGDAVLAALNLYRYILITESTGRTNRTGALSKEKLTESYREWLLPLRSLVIVFLAENQMERDHLANESVCALNPLEMVLYHCIELVEEIMK